MATNGTTADDTSTAASKGTETGTHKSVATLREKDSYGNGFRGEGPDDSDPDEASSQAVNGRTIGHQADLTRTPGATSNNRSAQSAAPLPAAMGYCARRILEAIDDTGDAGAQAAFAALTPATRELLRWWFGRDASRRRRRNFNCGQREAILHTVLAHELFGSDDPHWLFRAACSAKPGEFNSCADAPRAKEGATSAQPHDGVAQTYPRDTRSALPDAITENLGATEASEPIALLPAYAAYCLRMAPGAGGRWALQALLVWQWAGHAAAQTRGASDPRFDDRFALLVPNQATMRRFETALFGSHSSEHAAVPSRNSLLRHADVFLPPHLRVAFAQWLACSASTDTDGTLRIGVLDDARQANGLNHGPHVVGDASRIGRHQAPVRLVIGDGATLLAQDADAHNDVGLSGLKQPCAAGQCRRPLAAPHLLWIELDCGHEDPPPGAAVLADLSLARALRTGAVKSLLLADIGASASAWPRRSASPPRRRGLRPVLPRCERHILDAGLRLLERFELDTRALRAHLTMDAAPALLVLCEDLALRRAVAAYARTHGFERESIVVCDADNGDAQQRARIVIDMLPARHAAMQSRFCAIVLLRSADGATTAAGDLGELLWPALAPHWHDPALAESKAENREHIGAGTSPCNLIDVLTAIAASWPAPMRESSREGQALLRIGIDALPPPCDDLFVTELRDDASDVDIVLPDPTIFAPLAPLRWLSQLPRRLLRTRQCLPVRKCVYHHQGWSAHNNGLECGLIEMADADPHIAAFCVFDAQRQPWPGLDDHPEDAKSPCPNALVRTPGYVYVVQFAAYLPQDVRAARPLDERIAREHATFDGALPNRASLALDMNTTASASARTGRDAIAGWCQRVNALPADRRQFREWRAVQLQAPLFWSWKRRGGTLSSLLSALADTTPITLSIITPTSAQSLH